MQKNLHETDLFEAIQTEASKIDQFMRTDLDGVVPDIDELLYEVLEYGLFNGGKRLRPILVLLTARLCGGRGSDMYRLACAFEYLHAATLFHDDIIDKSETRRGKMSVHKKFGNTSAILAGDFLLAYSMERIGEVVGRSGLKIFCRAAAGMVDGEFMQLRNAETHNLSELDYHNVIMGKTAMLISAACEIGSMYGGGNSSQQSQLKNYGANLGCAFQIVDDLLDYLGDPQVTGKVVGSDLQEGKMTLPLIITLKNANTKDRKKLMEVLGSTALRFECVKDVTEIIDRYNGFGAAKQVAIDAVYSATSNLQGFDSKEVMCERTLLERLASYVIERKK